MLEVFLWVQMRYKACNLEWQSGLGGPVVTHALVVTLLP